MHSDPSEELPVAVIVVTYNSAGLVPDLVASLRRGMAPLPWRLVVADNDSSDGSVEAVEAAVPDAVVVRMGGNRGYAAGINAAVAAAPACRALLVLNPDVRLEPGCGPALLEALAEPGTGIAVPRLVDARGDIIWSLRRAPRVRRVLGDASLGTSRAGRRGWGEMITRPDAYLVPGRAEWAEGSTQMIAVEAWAALGEWDESYFLFSEETEYHLRAGRHGLAVRYVPHALAQHLEGGSAGSETLYPLVVANKWLLFRRSHGSVHTLAFWLALVAREASRSVLGRAESVAALKVLTSPRRLTAPRGPEWLEAVSASA